MNKNRVITAVLALSLVAPQLMMAADKPIASIVNRVGQEYQAFREAFTCVKGFAKCSSSESIDKFCAVTLNTKIIINMNTLFIVYPYYL